MFISPSSPWDSIKFKESLRKEGICLQITMMNLNLQSYMEMISQRRILLIKLKLISSFLILRARLLWSMVDCMIKMTILRNYLWSTNHWRRECMTCQNRIFIDSWQNWKLEVISGLKKANHPISGSRHVLTSLDLDLTLIKCSFMASKEFRLLESREYTTDF